jgi:hypothetical protein
MDELGARAEARHRQLMREMDEWSARAEARHRQTLERSQRGETVLIEALTDIDASIKGSVERLDEIGGAIRANTRAVISVLERLEPGQA